MTGYWATLCLLLAGPHPQAADEDASLARHFGFGPMQVYKIKRGTSDMQLADLNGDGRTDIAVWNSWQNRIELFYQRTGEPDARTAHAGAAGGEASAEGVAAAAGDAAAEREATAHADGSAHAGGALEVRDNEILDRGDLRRDTLPVAHRVACMRVAELTGDERMDIVYFGEPRELVVLPGTATGFGTPLAQRALEGDPRPVGLAVGDFNSDGRVDVALRGDRQILLFYQQEQGGLARPERIVHGIEQAMMLLAGDLNGDGRDDLLLSVDDEQHGMYVFIQEPAGGIGPMQRVRMPRVRSVTIAPRDDGPDDVLVIEQATNRLRVLRWGEPQPTAGKPSDDWSTRLYAYPLATRAKRRPVATGDVDGDGRTDVVVATPDAAQLVLFRGVADGLRAPAAYPGLVKTDDLQIADLDGDGVGEALSLSREEKMIGVSRFEGGRLSFPAALPSSGVPQAVTCGTLSADGSGPVVLVYLARHETDGKRTWRLHISDPQTGEQRAAWDIEAPPDDPASLRLADVDQDGLNDLLVFVQYAPLTALLQQGDGTFAPLGDRARSGLVKDAALEDFSLADVNGDGRAELVLAQKNLARALRVEDGVWTVVDQFNPDTADAELKGLAALPRADGDPTVVAYDRASRALIALQRGEAGSYRVTRTVPIGPFEISAILALDLGGETALLVVDPARLALLRPDEAARGFVELASFESELDDVWLADSVVADVNGDGVRDVVVVDVRKAYLELLTTRPDGALSKVLHTQVFQGKRFSDEPRQGGEPHQVLAGDVTGDGVDDLTLLVHDRLIVYPGQGAGPRAGK